eukprot:TRINITY_DN27305_c0_g1_i1.p1 TRINITY_DN27305_c0_g1~~TRINITY_DN27305_c0_g1_i1.p1  ORF type:complete len:566 (+),score=160.31 TRINITY_DN27305_c0_g1_i1:45-1742(+)
MRIYALLALLKLSAACSNILVTPGASVDGAPQIAYAADDGTVFGHLRHFPAGTNPPGTMMKVWDWDSGIYLGEVDDSGERYNVVGNMNEHGLIIGETTFGGLEQLSTQPGSKMDYGTLIWTTLSRVKTAREAIHTMYNLTQAYGYYSTGETFSIADTEEVWVMDFIGKGPGEKGAVFIARKIPNGMVCAHANQARIRTWDWSDTTNNIWAPDVVTFAKSKGLYKGTNADFSFSDIYDPVTFSGARLGEARAWSVLMSVAENRNFGNQYLDYAQGHNLTNRMPLFVTPYMKLSVNDTMWYMRTHFDDTWFDESKDVGAGAFHARYRERPLVWEHEGKQYVNERTIGVQQTGWNFVAHSRGSYLPKEVGPVIWFAVDDTSTCVHFPAYANSKGVPSTWAAGTSGSATEFVLRSAFWSFNLVANFAYFRWDPVFPAVQKKIVELESRYMTELAAMDSTLLNYIKNGQTEQAISAMTQFTISTGDGLVDEWVQFWMNLFVKYRDGFVTTPVAPVHPQDRPVPNCAEPGFDDAWRKRIVDEAGSKYIVWNATGPTGRLTDQDMHKLKFIK